MSRESTYLLSESAINDLTEIKRYSNILWEKERANRYLKDIHNKRLNICSFPHIGLDGKDIGLGLKYVIIESHVIFYNIHNDQINIARILHQNMDFAESELSSSNY